MLYTLKSPPGSIHVLASNTDVQCTYEQLTESVITVSWLSDEVYENTRCSNLMLTDIASFLESDPILSTTSSLLCLQDYQMDEIQ